MVVTAKPHIPLDTAADLRQLLELNYDVVEPTDNAPSRDRRRYYMEGLASKLYGHAVTAFHLWENGTQVALRSVTTKFVDWPSIQVLARACTESLTAFNYVYVGPANSDEADFRYMAWMLAGFTQRVELVPGLTERARVQLAKDEKFNEKLRPKIQKTATFQALNRDQKKKVLSGRNWHPDKSLAKMCEDVLGETWGRTLYAMMSSSAHSDALSAVQVMQVKDARAQAETAMMTIGFVLAHMSEAYASKWVAARKVYSKHLHRDINQFYLDWKNYRPEDFGFKTPTVVPDEPG